jgi:hypothetical protein
MEKYSPENELIPLKKEEPLVLDTITHYTSIPVLFKILRNNQILFNRIDNVNDLEEKDNLMKHENYQRVFISCFSTQNNESIPMWRMYTNKDTGIMLKIKFLKGITVDNLFFKDYMSTSDGEKISIIPQRINSSSVGVQFDTLKIVYTDKMVRSPIMTVDEGKKDYDVPAYFAMEKSSAWRYEKEIRFRAVLREWGFGNDEIPEVSRLFARINFNAIEKITVVFNPWIDKDDWADIIKEFVSKQKIVFE